MMLQNTAVLTSFTAEYEEKKMDEKRFERTYKQGVMDVVEIWVDRQTGVNYIFRQSGYAGGISPLLDREGKPVITPIVK